jgi:hypothetical protein
MKHRRPGSHTWRSWLSYAIETPSMGKLFCIPCLHEKCEAHN